MDIKKLNMFFGDAYMERSLETFLKLPRQAQKLLWATLEIPQVSHFFAINGPCDEEDIKSLTPIEIIFKIAFELVCFMNDAKIPIEKIGNPIDGSPVEIMIYNTRLEQQKEIIIDDKKYVVDFIFDGENGDFAEKIGQIKVIIECDGHDFHHKTKKQVEYDNERQLALQTVGYEVIRFSGSQIYKDPLGCAEKAYKYIMSMIYKSKNNCYNKNKLNKELNKEIKKSNISNRDIEMSLYKLDKLAITDKEKIKIVQQSIMNTWNDFFVLKKEK